ncbi:MAG: chemotaxis protein [Gammaproteobacteria bacterium]|nr:chemotaxis protein [Gammaproteobacteria bacterium]MDH5629570.1 chemotaxis protein [Gammaproteobacteria bacterium]
MTGILDTVNQRTQMVGKNRLELLLFKLQGKQIYGINVFKVKEVLQCPDLIELPQRHRVVRGVAHIRGSTISVIDMSMAIGGPQLVDIKKCFVVIAEYNRRTQGFLVNSVERIINMNWGKIHPPPKGSGKSNYLTAVTQIENDLVEIIDVEKILSEVSPTKSSISQAIIDKSKENDPKGKMILIADDSSVARKQVEETVEQLGYKAKSFQNGREALDFLKQLTVDGQSIENQVFMLVSDIEMPEMDGYTLTAAIRGNERLSKLWVVLHTSLSGVFNHAMVEKVGANDFVSKFNPDELAEAVQRRIEADN